MMRKKSSLIINLLCLSLLPLLILCTVISLLTVQAYYKAMEKEVENGLGSLAGALSLIYEHKSSGNYMEENGVLKKGELVITGDNTIVDRIKKSSNVDSTIFWEDVRVVTSIRNADGSRATGTHVSAAVAEQVLGQGQPYFSSDVLVNGNAYFGYYLPIFDGDGKPAGMFFVGKPRYQVLAMIRSIVTRVIIVSLILLLVTAAFAVFNAKSIIRLIRSVMRFLSEIAEGNVYAQVNPVLLKRTDEIGEIGIFATRLQSSIIELIGTDPLTGLYNRRSGGISLENILSESVKRGSVFTVGIGDIDSFKMINDNFGHTCGDHVLRRLALLFETHMEDKGFVARWGGEEFLFIYEKADLRQAYDYMSELLAKVRELKIQCNDNSIRVTLTFGLAQYTPGCTIDGLIEAADENLYKGKRSDKNQVVM